MKKLIIFGIAIAALVLVGVFDASAGGPSCIKDNFIKLDAPGVVIDGDHATARVQSNATDTCEVYLVSYKIHSNRGGTAPYYFEGQTIHDVQSKTIAPGQTVSLRVEVPPCFSQVDLSLEQPTSPPSFSSQRFLGVQFANPLQYCNETPQIDLSAIAGTLTCPGIQAQDTRLNWNQVSGAATYQVQRASVSGGPYTTIATGITATAFSESPIAGRAFYRVRAINGSGQVIIASNEVRVDVATPTCQGVTLTITPGTLACPGQQNTPTRLSWNGISGAGSYQVQRSSTSGGSYTTIATLTALNYSDPVSAGTFFYRVRALNSSGQLMVTSNEVSATIATPTCTTPSVTCSPTNRSVLINDIVQFSAQGGNGSFVWTAPGSALPNGTTGSFTTFYPAPGNYTVAVTSGSSQAFCFVSVTSPTTPTPTPPPSGTLTCSPSSQVIASGTTTSFRAFGGTGIYFWSAPGGDPNQGFFQDFVTRFTTSAFESIQNVTVRSGGETATCVVRVVGGTIPTPTPTVTPIPGIMSVQKLGRNLTQGQAVESSNVFVRGNDTVEFVIRVRSLSSSTLTNVIVTDVLPQGVDYIPNTTSVNNIVVQNGVTGGGINIGSLVPNQEALIRFSALIAPGTTFPNGTLFATNVVYARADNTPTFSAQLPLSRTSIGTVAGVQTGPGETLLFALLFSGAMTYGYMRYTRTSLFNRRDAMAKVRHYMGDTQRLNFMRFMK